MDALRSCRSRFSLVAWGILVAATPGCALFQPVVTPFPPTRPVTQVMDAPASQPAAEAEGDAAASDESADRIEAWATALAEQRQRGDGRPAVLADDQGAAARGRADAAPMDDMATGKSDPAAGTEGVDEVIPAAVPVTVAKGGGQESPAASAKKADVGEAASAPPAPKSPPTLLSVNVAPGGDGPRTTGGGSATEANQGQASQVAASLREFVARLPGEGGNASLVEEVDRRLLHALAGQAGEARAPLKYADPAQARLLEGMIDLVLALREHPDATRLEQARQTLDKLQGTLRDVSDLAIPTLTLCTRVDGFGRYTELDPPEFRVGGRNEFVAYCELRNFASQREADGQHRSEFSLRLDVRNRLGDLVHEFAGEDIVDRCRSPRTDCFIAPLIRLPAGLAPGDYVVKVTLIDKIGQKVAQRRCTLRIVAEQTPR